MRLFKLLAFLFVVGFVGLVGYAYLGDMTPPRTERSVPVTLDAN